MTPRTTTTDTTLVVLNELRRGTTYRATTHGGTTVGEYLGLETPHGVRALLLRHDATLAPYLFGGHQEAGRRPGTEPRVPGEL